MPSGVDRDEIRTAFNSYPADIAFVEITPENTAFVRLRAENDAKLVSLYSISNINNTSYLNESLVLGPRKAG